MLALQSALGSKPFARLLVFAGDAPSTPCRQGAKKMCQTRKAPTVAALEAAKAIGAMLTGSSSVPGRRQALAFC